VAGEAPVFIEDFAIMSSQRFGAVDIDRWSFYMTRAKSCGFLVAPRHQTPRFDWLAPIGVIM